MNVMRSGTGVSSGLSELGIFHRPVAVYLEQSAESIVSFLGAAYSGNFYTVLDSKMPTERLRKIVEVLEPAVILTDEKHFADAQIFAGGVQGYSSSQIFCKLMSMRAS